MSSATRQTAKFKSSTFYKFFAELREELFGTYRPEKRYMRGAERERTQDQVAQHIRD